MGALVGGAIGAYYAGQGGEAAVEAFQGGEPKPSGGSFIETNEGVITTPSESGSGGN